jgi:hypothetical protein
VGIATDRDRAGLKAENQAVFREVNERIAEITKRLDNWDAGRLEVLCECSRPDCVGRIDVSAEEYDEVRGAGDTFIVVDGHHDDGIEDVIRVNDRFAVVRLRLA